MKQDHSSAFVNITGSVFVSICLMIGTFLAVSFSNEEKKYLAPRLNPEVIWDETMCRCLSEEAEEPETIVLQSKSLLTEFQPGKLLANIDLGK